MKIAHWRWHILVALILTLASTPFFSADRFGPRIRAGLESALGRKVDIGKVRLHILTGPGFSVRNVVIHEDPSISAEPFAYVDDLVVSLRLTSLLAGKLEFSSLRLVKPHVNLMRTAEGAWNVQRLFAPASQTAGSNTPRTAPLPELQVQQGRVNFKLNDTKSVYYFTGADIDFSYLGNGDFDIWFVGEPARTDGLARGFGRVTARGRLRDTPAEPRLDLDVRLERSALQEFVQLLGGRDAGIYGNVQTRAELSGPLSNLKLTGRLDLTELRPWSQPPRATAVSTSFAGQVRLASQSFSLETAPSQPLRASLQVNDLFGGVQWSFLLDANAAPLAPLADWIRPAEGPLSNSRLAGTLTGSFHAGSSTPTSARLELSGLDWTWGDNRRFTAPVLQAALADGRFQMEPAPASLDGQSVNLECDGAIPDPSWECRLSTRGHDLRDLRQWTRALGARSEWLDNWSSGLLRGSIALRQAGFDPPDWRANFEIRNAELRIPELRTPIKVSAASAQWLGSRLILSPVRGSVANNPFTAFYRYEAATPRPHRLSLELDALGSPASLEPILGPALRRPENLFSQALRIAGAADASPGSGGAEIDLRVASLPGDTKNLRLHLLRESDRLAVPALGADWLGGKITASGVVRLATGEPEYDFTGKLTGLPWSEGTASSDWKLTARGTGSDLLRSFRLSGSASAQSFVAGDDIDSASGNYRIEMTAAGPRASFDRLEASVGNLKMPGRVTGKPEGPLYLEFSAEGRDLRLRVNLQPFEILPAPEAAAR
jgi:hypothetical protein